jgi:hypothetical protein
MFATNGKHFVFVAEEKREGGKVRTEGGRADVGFDYSNYRVIYSIESQSR